MKLLTVLMLIALPLSCFADSGCLLLEDLIHDTIDSKVTISVYLERYQHFLNKQSDVGALVELKECFLDQEEQTLEDVQLLMETIYNSDQCDGY